jgi:signal transduction histidine kinase
MHADTNDEHHLRIRAVVTGTGIPPEVVPCIFDRGFTTNRQDTAWDSDSLSARRSSWHTGDATEVRTGIGQGTTMRVRLPVIGGERLPVSHL